MPQVALYLLGTPRLELDGVPVHITRRKVMALLAYLAITGQPHGRETLVTLLSPELDTRHARAEFRRTLAVLKSTLGPGFIQATGEFVVLQPSADSPALGTPELWLDVAEFRARLAPCQDAAHPPGTAGVCAACAPRLQEAVTLYGDDFLAGFNLPESLAFEEWQFFQAEELQQLLSDTLTRLVKWHSAQGGAELERAIAYAQRGLALNPLHEAAHQQLMALYARAGRRAAALRQYRKCLRVLEELGVPVSAETTALYTRIRAKGLAREEAALQPDAALAPVSTPPPAFLTGETPPGRAERPLFVGRAPELTRLDGWLQAALQGRGQIALITGGPGRGKTALMEAFARRAMEAHPDLLVAGGQCTAYAGAGDPYLPFRDLLGMFSGDVEAGWRAGTVSHDQARRLWAAFPRMVGALLRHGGPLLDILLPSAVLLSRAEAYAAAHAGEETAWLAGLRQLSQRGPGGSGEHAQSQLFEACEQVLHTVAIEHPLLLLLDDLQWVDTASAGLLFHLSRRLAGSPIMILGAYRPEEITSEPDGHPLAKPLAEFKRAFGDVWLDLTQADESEGRAFVDALLDAEPNRLGEPFRQALFQHTGGHPLFTVELLGAMQVRGNLIRDQQGRWVEGPALDWERMPPRVEGVIQERAGRLKQNLRDILSIASVEGESFFVEVVATIQGSDPRQLLRALSHELAGRHRLVRELEPLAMLGHRLYRYRFSHVLFQQYLYNDLSEGERALLHGEVAQALEALYEGQTDTIAVPLAHHYAQAGNREKAIFYHQQAGDRARMAYALDEAIAHYRGALSLQEETGDHDGAARTWLKLGLAHHNAFQFRAARQAYDAGFRLWQRVARLGSAATVPPAPHVLRVMFPVTISTLDPTVGGDFVSYLVIGHLFSGLLEQTPDHQAVPDLAQRWDLSPDGRRYLFHLREDVCWSDGVPVTAADFEFAWKRMLSPRMALSTASTLYDIQGARAFHQGEVQNAGSVGVRARDRWSLEVVLEEPVAYFPLLLALLYPVPRHVVAACGDAWAEPQHIVTNGPFRLEAWLPDGKIVLVRNPDYHGRFPGNVERVEFAPRPEDPTQSVRVYEEDRLDVFYDIDTHVLNLLMGRHSEECVAVPELGTVYLCFNLRRPPFDDQRVRRAFVLATDRERFTDGLFHGRMPPATGGLVPPGMPGHVPGIALPFDPIQARQLLAEAGYGQRGGRAFPRVELLSIFTFLSKEGDLARQWRENLSIEVVVEAVSELHDLFKRFGTNPPHILVSGWLADYPDPDTFMRVLINSRAAGWEDKTYQRLIEQARGLTDQRARMALYGQAERILAQEAPLVPLVYSRNPLLVKPWVKGFLPSAGCQACWKHVILQPH